MKTPFGKNTFHFLLAGTIALTPIAANLTLVTNSAHAAVTTQSTSLQDQIYQNLSSSDIAAINAANSKITKLSDAQITSIIGQDLKNKIDGKAGAGRAVQLVKDLANLQYQSSSTAYDQAVANFKTNHSADFDKIFDGQFSVDNAISLFSSFKPNLKTELFKSLLQGTPSNFNDIIAAAINDSTKNTQFDNLLTTKLGISVNKIVDLRTQLEKAADPSYDAFAALFSGIVRSNGGAINGAGSVNLGSSSIYSFNFSIGSHFTWKTSNSLIAYFSGNKLVTKSAGKIKIYVYYLDRPILTKDVTILDKTAPAVPYVYSVGYKDKVIKGKAEKYSAITVKKGRTIVASGKTNSSGIFSVSMKTTQKTGTVLTVTAMDASKNVSKAKTVTVVDKYAPTKPYVYTVHSKNKVISGKAEASSTVTIKKGSKVLAYAKVSSKGKFSVRISAQKSGTVLYVTAKDKANNVSQSTKVIVKR